MTKTMSGAYGVVYTYKNDELRFLVAKYNDGYGLLGGRIDNNEEITSAFIRELNEEVGITEKDINTISLADKTHSFESKRSKIGEKHYFIMVNIKETATPVKKDVDFKWLTFSQMQKFTKLKDTQKIISELIKNIPRKRHQQESNLPTPKGLG